MRARRGIRLTVTAVAAATIVAATAGPALADPAGPTNYESTITTIEPPSNAATFEVIGGDAFLEVSVAPGHTVAVPGYFGEPYIRIDADGSVWINDDSKTRYENEERYGAEPPPEADGVGEPRWRRVADNGVYAWHDHRVHWMSRDIPPAVAGDTRRLVFPWRVAVIIDGTETVIQGDLVWVPSVNPWPMVMVGAALIAVTALIGRRRRSSLGSVGLLMAVAAGIVVVAQHVATPVSARGLPAWIVFPLIAASAAGFAVRRRSIAGFTPDHLLLVSGLSLAAWGYATIDVLSKPIIPSALPPLMQRVMVAGVQGAGVGIALLAVVTVLRRAGDRDPV